MLFYLLLCTGLFGFIVFKAIKEKNRKQSPMIFGAMVFALLCSVIALGIYWLVPNHDLYLFFMIALMIGGLMVILAIHNLSSVFLCKAKVEGIYCGFRTYSGGNGTSSHAPVFDYMYQGKHYHEQSAQSASYQLLAKRMITGERYTIYVNEQYPNAFILKKKIQFGDVMLLFFGILCLIVGILPMLSLWFFG